MATGLYVAVSGARAQEHRLETLSNDLANAQTPGFKTQATLYQQIHSDVTKMGDPNQAMGLNHPVRFLPEDRLPVVMTSRYTKFSQGSLRFTGNDLDLAINGDGFFTLQGPKGVQFTRNGNFTLTKDGVLTDQDGSNVLARAADGRFVNIKLPNAQGNIKISREGQIFVGDEYISEVAITKFADPQKLHRMGNSRWTNPDPKANPREPDRNPNLHQGHLELANVNPIRTMAMLIKTNRIFELNTRALQAYKAMDDSAIRDVGRPV
jgi:flagellar basal-body rod protein FlgG